MHWSVVIGHATAHFADGLENLLSDFYLCKVHSHKWFP